MPSQSTLDADDKVKIKNAIPQSSQKIHFAALARIYYAYPQPNKWSYSGLQGALVSCTNTKNNISYFKMVDLDGTRGLIWEHELYMGLELNRDRAFFLSFAGDKCMIGFVFADESEAKTFLKKTKSNKDTKAKKARSEKSKSSKGGKVDKSMIPGPKTGSFIHVAHMGYDADSGFTSKGVDPSWMALLGNLESTLGKDVVAREIDYIKSFVTEYQGNQDGKKAAKEPKKRKLPPPPSRGHVANGSVSSQSAAAPPPPPTLSINGPPPPPSRPPAPPSRPQPPPRIPARAPSPEEVATPVAPPPPQRPASQKVVPPPPPARPSVQAGGRPPPPARPSNGPSKPPPPPSRPAPPSTSQNQDLSSSVPPPSPPPPPPPPPTMGNGGPPPPVGDAPPSVKSMMPAPQPGRGDLLASIHGKGIHSLWKTDPSACSRSPPPESNSTSTIVAGAAAGGTAAAGGDLTSALAATLLERNERLGDSDDDEEEDDEDWEIISN